MPGFAQSLRKLFRKPTPSPRSGKRRLELETLEDRSLLSTNVAPLLSGQAFVDRAHTGKFQTGDAGLAGVTVTLTGTTFLGTSITSTTTTDAKGNFQFALVPNGTYQLSFSEPAFLPGSAGIGNVSTPTGVTVVSGIVVGAGQSVTGGQLAFQGIDPHFISERMFLSSSTASSLPGTTPGAGSAGATGPFLSKAKISDVNLGSVTGTQNIDLAGFFSAPDITTSQVNFNITAGGKTFTLQVELFDAQTPQTVANFLDYVRSGGYNHSIFHRLTSVAKDRLGVLQGGGESLPASPNTTLTAIPVTNQGVANE
ncbi:MAG TPA: SdrD B-like domain-containing protein, partial [Gemmataceae bacterium]|nr:SdrD B-like domain-containing protein [Gemmataceae bacterium]